VSYLYISILLVNVCRNICSLSVEHWLFVVSGYVFRPKVSNTHHGEFLQYFINRF
jgi:hypothetical protein